MFARLVLVLAALLSAAPLSEAQQGGRSSPPPARQGARPAETPKPPAIKPPEAKPPDSAAAPQAVPFLPPMLRLSETMGALSLLTELCGEPQDGRAWRVRMEALLEAEGGDEATRQTLAGAFNNGFRAYEITYRRCTPSARAAIEVLLADGSRISRELNNRYGY